MSLTNETSHGWTPFTTLSYTWGKPSPIQRAVLIHGQMLEVRQNLHDFLDSASKAGSRIDEWLWIDQICIDQGNSRERNHQVAQMARIYQSSTRTLVWLGTGFDGSSRLIAAFNATDTRRIGPQIAAACRQLSQLSYWSRLWICQEVV
ncbi:heterokaryon incompatibility, partial [Lepidopterella palustris CBS 459.81]